MSTSRPLSSGSPGESQAFTTAPKKPLTVSPSDDVNLLLETVTGKLVNPTNPTPAEICLDDIAWGLSRIPRFMGHTITEVPYNVAQHSIYVSELMTRALAHEHKFFSVAEWAGILKKLEVESDLYGQNRLLQLALLHDAHEAYLGDIPSPIKRIPELRETYRLLELKFDHAIRSAFGLEEPTPDTWEVIHFFDKLAQAIEGYQFMRSRGTNWVLPSPTLELLQKFPAPLTAIQSYKAFLGQFNYLRNQ